MSQPGEARYFWFGRQFIKIPFSKKPCREITVTRAPLAGVLQKKHANPEEGNPSTSVDNMGKKSMPAMVK
jgi:hypothetical protein